MGDLPKEYLNQVIVESRTKREIDFLKKLGTHCRSPARPQGIGIPKHVLLERYRNSMHLRDNWGGIYFPRVRKYLDKELSKEPK